MFLSNCPRRMSWDGVKDTRTAGKDCIQPTMQNLCRSPKSFQRLHQRNMSYMMVKHSNNHDQTLLYKALEWDCDGEVAAACYIMIKMILHLLFHYCYIMVIARQYLFVSGCLYEQYIRMQVVFSCILNNFIIRICCRFFFPPLPLFCIRCVEQNEVE